MVKLKDVYPLYLNNKAAQPNTSLEVIDKYTGEVAFRTALATPDVPNPEGFVRLFFSGPEETRAKGMEYFARISARSADPDEQTDRAARDAQLEAITRWGIPDPSKLARLGAITQPTLVANGDDDKMMLTENSRLLAQQVPDARLSIYPDSGHGFLDQYPQRFAEDVRSFLDGD